MIIGYFRFSQPPILDDLAPAGKLTRWQEKIDHTNAPSFDNPPLSVMIS
ncbi:MAG TPA: hypothetical protein VGD99_05345 [Anaerolineae bacterium]